MNYMPIEDLKILGYDVEVKHDRMYDQRWDNRRRNYLNAISPKGGVTKVTVVDTAGIEYYGLAECSPKDNFNRKLGVRIALGRALKKKKFIIVHVQS